MPKITNQELSDDIKDMVDSDILLLPSTRNFGHYLLDENWFPQMNPEETIIGNPNPDWLGSVRFSWNYKSTLRVSALFDIKYGGDIWNGTKGALYYFGAHEETTLQTMVPFYIKNQTEKTTGLKTWYEGEDVGSFNVAHTIDNEDGTLTFRGYLDDFGDGLVAVTEEAYYFTLVVILYLVRSANSLFS